MENAASALFSDFMCEVDVMEQKRRQSSKLLVKRLSAIALCAAIVFSILPLTSAQAGVADATGITAGVARQADPSTMDTYGDMIDLSENTRYVGRLWTDKSVFAYGEDDSGNRSATWSAENNQLTLTSAQDGTEGTVNLDTDFLEVYSALGSSMAINRYPRSPIDLVIAIDMSASMGQDTRFSVDSIANEFINHQKKTTGWSDGWKEGGVSMEDRIANSRIQATLTALNKTITNLMKQNPQNRVAVIGYGANATVLMPLAHWRSENQESDKDGTYSVFLKVGGMETLLYPGDLVAKDAGWFWMNNRDTCYTVIANAEMNTDVTADFDTKEWKDWSRTVSNNVYGGTYNEAPTYQGSGKVKAFPGVAKQTPEELKKSIDDFKAKSDDIQQNHVRDEYTAAVKSKEGSTHGESLIEAVKDTKQLTADEYVGYLTNTQGGIYLAYRQLLENENPTTYAENGGTVARVPAAIIMTDGGANFAFNPMGTVENGFKYDSNLSDNTIIPLTYKQWISNGTADIYPDGEHERGFGELREIDSEIFYKDGKHYSYYGKNYGSYDVLDKYYRLLQGDTPDLSEYSVKNPGNLGDEWYKVWLPSKENFNSDENYKGVASLCNPGADLYQDGTLSDIPGWDQQGVLYCSDNTPLGTSGTTIEVLLTASYMKSAVKKYYEEGWNTANIPTENRPEKTIQTYTMAVDTRHLPQWGKMRLYPTMDPANYPLEGEDAWWSDTSKFGENDDFGNGGVTKERIYTDMRGSWNAWKGDPTGEDSRQKFLINVSNGKISICVDRLPEGGDNTFDVNVTKEDVISNIEYSDRFYDEASGSVGIVFEDILSRITTPPFTPLTGENDLGTEDSLTFMDPMGKYMEVKDVENLVLFGVNYDVTKTAVYSYEFNETYKEYNSNDVGSDGSLIEGWYKGNDGASAERWKESGVPKGSEEAAWADGWMYRLNAKTASTFVPSIADIKQGGEEPDDIVQKMRHTEYTFYRVDETEAEREKLRMNPAYRDSDSDVLEAGDPGVYCLNDLRIWVEDTGDYNDDSIGGGMEIDTNFDEALWINIPQYMLPLRTVTLTEDADHNWTYKTNLRRDSTNYPENGEGEFSDPYYASFPLRVFYTVGIEESLLTDDRHIKIADVSQEYIGNNRVATGAAETARALNMNDLEFFSNWYNPENRYSGYTDNATDYSFGDPASTFQPASNNRYYIFQNPMPLYTKAHIYKGGTWREITGDNVSEFSEGTVDGTDYDSTDEVESPAEGDIILLKGDRLTEKPTDFENRYYFMRIDFFNLLNDEDRSAEQTKYCVKRKGGEFTSVDGQVLCWYQVSSGDVKDYSEQKPEGDDWVLAAKQGGLRTGRLVQAIGRKTLGQGGGEYTEYQNYAGERFPGKAIRVGYYAGNITRTANNYYLPTISTNSGDGQNHIIVNTYLGNNGRLWVPDSGVLLTKRVEPKTEGGSLPDTEYSFDVKIEGLNGSYDAIVVRYNEQEGRWERQFHYIDLVLDGKLFLQTTDGQKATVNVEGELQSGDSGDYYVYIGSNTGGAETGGSENALRVYHNTDVHQGNPEDPQYGPVSPDDVTGSIEEGFSAAKVWLVSKEQYKSQWENRDPEQGDPQDNEKELYTKTLENFKLLFLAFDKNSTEVEIESEYLTDSAYWTQSILFQNGSASVDLKHGEGLLFTGLPVGSDYTFAEHDPKARYELKYVDYVTSGGTKRQEGEEFPDHSNGYAVSGKTETDENQAHYVNTVESSGISIIKILEAGPDAPLTDNDRETEFTFTLQLTDPDTGSSLTPPFSYEISGNGNPIRGWLVDYGEADSENDIAANDPNNTTWSFRLKGGQTMRVDGLPLGADYTYTVTEVGASSDEFGYDVGSSQDRGNPDSDGESVVSGAVTPEDQAVEVEFKNIKRVRPVTVELPLSKKVTETDDFNWTGKTFTFLVEPASNNPEGDPLEDGKTVDITIPEGGYTGTAEIFGENLQFSRPGIFVYTITEKPSDIPGIRTDLSIYTVTVKVTERYNEQGVYTGNLNAKVTVTKDGTPVEDATVTFENFYDASQTQVQVPIQARKSFTGGKMWAHQFQFELTGVSAEYGAEDSGSDVVQIDTAAPPMPDPPPVAPEPEPWENPAVSQWNDENGVVNFGNVTFTRAGTYTYTMREIAGDDGGIRYDGTVFKVVIIITGEGTSEDPLTLGGIQYFVDDIEWTPDDPNDVPVFTNELKTGSLTVSKTVAGTGDRAKDWHFRVELNDTSVNGQYGEMTFVDGVAEFTLKHGESRTALGLPPGVIYTVTEREANQDGYKTSMSEESGEIAADDTAAAEFINSKPDLPPETPPVSPPPDTSPPVTPPPNASLPPTAPSVSPPPDTSPPATPSVSPPLDAPPPTAPPGVPPDNPPDVPETGDNGHTGLWLTLMLLSFGGLVALLVPSARKKHKTRDRNRRGKHRVQ